MTAHDTKARDPRIGLLTKRLRDARSRQSEAAVVPSIPVADDDQRSASFSQERMWLLEQMLPGYNTSTVIRVHGRLDVDVLRDAFAVVVERHEVLRTVFDERDGVPVPRVLPAGPVPILLHDLAGQPVAGRDERGIEIARRAMREPFDLGTGPVLRVEVVSLAEQEALLVVVVHHVAIDGSSMGTLWSELSTAYEALAEGRSPVLPALPIQYGDYAAWSRTHLAPDKLGDQLDFWRRRMSGATAAELPTDHPRPAVRTGNGAQVSFEIDAELGAAVLELATRQRATPFMALLAVFNAVLARHSASTDVTVGTPIAGRVRPELDGLIGFFVNTLLIRTDLTDDPSFAELVTRTRTQTLEAHQHQELPFEALLNELRPDRDPSRNPFFQVLFAVGDDETDNLTLPGLRTEHLDIVDGKSRFDLNVALTRRGTAFHGVAYYESDLFDHETITRFLRHYVTSLRAAVADPERPVSAIEMAEPTEHAQIRSWSVGEDVVFEPGLLPDVVDEVARSCGDLTAVVDERNALSYQELTGRANALAWRLRDMGVGVDIPVGVWMDRSIELAVVLLAIIKSGGAFVPLDPDLPAGRVTRILDEAGVSVMCTDTARVDRLAEHGVSVVECGPDSLAASRNDSPDTQLSGDHIVSVYFTSGSTGVPKGVASTHDGWANRMRWMCQEYPLATGESVLHKTVLSFDDAAVEIFWPLMSGGTVVMLPPGLHRDPRAIADYAEQFNIVGLHFVPSMLSLFCDEVTDERRPGLAGLRYVISSGEALRPDLVGRFYDRFTGVNVQLFNQWGATEVSIDSTSHACTPQDRDNPDMSLGGPIANNQVYLLDSRLNPVPIGVPGDLYLGGVGLARGYWGDPAKTAGAFVPSPFDAAERLYRTGDRGIRRTDGRLSFLGRADSQVKIRGIRIEPAEIEHVLRSHGSVSNAVVVKWEPTPGDARLAAYVTLTTDTDADSFAETASRYLGDRLPAYMVPSSVMVVDTIPVNANGKTDYRALPTPLVESAGEVTAPTTKAERLVADVWSEVLGPQDMDIHANFFALGGHSLLATKIVSRLRSVLDTDIPLAVIFDNPTIHAMATAVEGRMGRADAAIPRTGADDTPLSPSQRRLWILEQLRPDLVEYNLSQVLDLSGTVSADALDAALVAVAQRHSVLRSRVAPSSGTVRMRVEPPSVVTLRRTDLRDLPAEQAYQEALQHSRADADERFDLTRAPLLRARLTELPGQRFLFTLVVHHIAVDAVSMRIFWSELSRAYSAALTGEHLDAPDVLQFGDYATWADQHMTGQGMAGELGYWTDHLRGAGGTELRGDRPRPAERSGSGARLSSAVDPAVARGVRDLARTHNATGFMVLFAAFAALLTRHTGSTDVLVGTPIAGRVRPETEDVIGFFVNTLLLRTDLSGDPTFDELVERVRSTTLAAYEHQELPFDLLVDALQPERDLSRNPLFQIMFNQIEEQTSQVELPGVRVRSVPGQSCTARFDLDVTVVTEGERMEVVIDYATAVFDQSSVARFAEHFHQILAQAVAGPGTRLADLAVLTAEETRLLRDWNDTAVPQSDPFVDHLVDVQAARTPDEPAATGPDGTTLSYAELTERATALAATLREAGAGQDAPVAVLVERSTDLVVALLAVLKAGAAYLPLDPTYPIDRLEYMLADSGARLMLATPSLAESLGTATDVRLIDIGAPARPRADLPPLRRDPDDLAYVIYTSGSTGRPKGVMVPHRGVANFVLDMVRRLELTGRDTLCTVTTVAFDIAVLELYAPLACGARVVIADRETASDGTRLASLLRTSAATVVAATPATYHLLLLHGWTGRDIRAVSGGEALSRQLADDLLGRVSRLWNVYGPTETTVYSTVFEVTEDGTGAPVSIGRPIGNTTVYVVDDTMRPVPVGAVGELVIGGAGVVRGYRNRPALTAERFVPDPFGSGERCYRTGDLARWRPDGTLDYIGREDTQVKLRGYRIELGEIEAVLQRHPSVARAAVKLVGQDVSRRIVGYVAWRDAADDAGLHQFLRDRLPQYMIPSEVVGLSELPLTPNGKVDRKSLPEPGASTVSSAQVQPRDVLELRVTSLCERVLGRSPIGVMDDFFALGGNSLTAFELVEAVHRELGVGVPLSSFFRAPTVEGLCAALSDASAVADRLLVPLATGPATPPLYLVHPHGGGIASYVSLGRELDGRLTVHGIEAVGYNTDATPLDTVPAIADRYLAEISSAAPDRPRLLAGWSFGGVVAFEMAVRLEQAGRPVDALLLLDSPPPGSEGLQGDEDVIYRLGADAGLAEDEMTALDDDQLIAALVHSAHQAGRLPDRLRSSAVRRMVAVARANGVAAARYHTDATITSDVYLLTVSANHPTLTSPDIDPAAWQARTSGRVHEVRVSGSHYDMVHQPHAAELASRIADIVRTVRNGVPLEDK